MNNSAFISYRRSVSGYFARAVFQDLRRHKFDVFMDVESIDAGAFDTIILNQIAARPYFLLVLTPGTLERCGEPGDWLLREIEHAMNLNRVIVPVTSHNFDFADAKKLLKEPLATELPRFNGVDVPLNYFEEAMKRLRTRFLKPTEVSVTPTPKADEPAVQRKVAEIVAEPDVTENQLSAQDYAERAFKRSMDDLDGKIADYSEALLLDPNYVVGYNNRGIARQTKGDFDEAIADFSEAIRLDPKYAVPYNNRGGVRQTKGDFDGAIADFSEAIRLDPSYTAAYNNRGWLRQTKGDFDGAIADFSEAIRLNPKHVNAYINRGNVKQSKGDLEGAITDFSEAVHLKPQYAKAYYYRGLAYDDIGDTDRAIADYTVAIRCNPNYDDAYIGRGFSRQKKKDFKNAISDYNQAVKIDPNSSLGYTNLGEMYFELKQFPKALGAFRRAVKIDSENASGLAGLAITHHALQEFQKAQDIWHSLLLKDKQFQNPDWVGKEFNWELSLVRQARMLISDLL